MLVSPYIILADYETGSRNAFKTQPLQLAAVAIDSRKLKIVEDGIFQSYIQPIADHEKYGLDPIEDDALRVNKIERDKLYTFPCIDVVWPQFITFVHKYNLKKDKWSAPILAGFNNLRFDNVITERICGGNSLYNKCEKEPYKFGPWDDKDGRNKLFHPVYSIDLMQQVLYWFEHSSDLKKLSFDSLRDYFGMESDNAHNAVVDIIQSAHLLIRMMKLSRNLQAKYNIAFKGSFKSSNKEIASLIAQHL